MSTVDIDAPVADPTELDLLRPWREPVTPRRFLGRALGSIAFHLVVVAVFLSLPEIERNPQATVVTPDLRRSIPLVAPKFYEPTQTAANKSKITRPELDVRSEVETPRAQAPHFRPPTPVPGPIEPPQPVQTPAIEPPKIQVAAAPPPQLTETPSLDVAPPPAPVKPKLAFESVGSAKSTRPNPNPNPQLQIPKHTVEESVRAAARPGEGGVTVGDTGDDPLPSLNQIPSPGRMGSNLQLKSDPSGVDFKPYLIHVLTAVRRNWLAVIPESVRLGRAGQVSIVFSIDRRGGVPKLVIGSTSGFEALDRAAVAGISASNPFPPLPSEYKGDQIVLELKFSYNAPRR